MIPKSKNNNTIFYRKKQAFRFDFTAERISSDGGILLSEKIEREHGLLAEFADMLPDDRNPDYTEYTRSDQLKQRIYLMMQGYEDWPGIKPEPMDPLRVLEDD